MREEKSFPAWIEITKETYHYYLECMPPVACTGYGFLVGEPSDHFGGNPRYTACRYVNGQYRQSLKPMLVEEFEQLSNRGK